MSDQPPTMSDVITLLREQFPQGGDAQGRFHLMEDDRLFLDIEDFSVPGLDLTDQMPEEILGQERYERLLGLLHDLLDAGTLPGYTEGDKFYEFNF